MFAELGGSVLIYLIVYVSQLRQNLGNVWRTRTVGHEQAIMEGLILRLNQDTRALCKAESC